MKGLEIERKIPYIVVPVQADILQWEVGHSQGDQ